MTVTIVVYLLVTYDGVHGCVRGPDHGGCEGGGAAAGAGGGQGEKPGNLAGGGDH